MENNRNRGNMDPQGCAWVVSEQPVVEQDKVLFEEQRPGKLGKSSRNREVFQKEDARRREVKKAYSLPSSADQQQDSLHPTGENYPCG